MEDDPFGNLDDFLGEEDFSAETTDILIIGSHELYQFFNNHLDGNFYSVFFTTDLPSAAKLLLEHYFSIIIVDHNLNTDLEMITKRLRENHTLARIIITTDSVNSPILKYLYNVGEIDAVIPLQSSKQEIIKIIMEQDAKYAIQKGVTEFVSEPPELSKANFLLLDPSLSFGDEDAPLNFVGVMIVVNSVPKYNIFFEDTLRQDEVLFAAFLSSISSMGDELFQSEQSLKEINFGGISVIFRFDGDIQIAFLIKNLTRHNYNKAEERIDIVLNLIMEPYKENLLRFDVPNQTIVELNQIFFEFDEIDDIKEKEYSKLQDDQILKEFGTQRIILMTPESEPLNEFRKELSSYLEVNNMICTIQSGPNIDASSQIIRDKNVGVLIINSNSLNEVSGVFILESIQELDPGVQIILLKDISYSKTELLSILNSGNLNWIYNLNDDFIDIFESIEQGLQNSLRIKSQKFKRVAGSQSREGLSIAKAMLKEDLEAFGEEIKPELRGIVISKEMDPIFEKFWEYKGETINFNVSMMAGLVTGLKTVSGEIFQGGENVDALELAGHEVFIRFNSDYMFLYFLDNVTATTSVLISKEINAVTQLYSEIIAKSIGVLSAEQLRPIFNQIADSSHEGLTALLRDSRRNK